MIKKKVLFGFIISVISLMVLSCVSNEVADSDKVSQEEIYQTYRVTVDATDQTVTGFASFRFGGSAGTTLRLTAGSNVTWNGNEMPQLQNIFLGAFYEKTESASLMAEHSFVFTDTEQKSYTNVIEMMPAEPENVPSEYKASKSLKLSWVGQPLRDGEVLTCNLKDSSFTHSVSIDLVGATSIEIKPSDWNQTKKGLVNLSFERTYKQDLKEATHLGGTIKAIYVSKSYPIIVK
ncbi:MAG: hypothetical protein C0592_06335 [Marinilabiliales bacterium]|nr:MAG: hypothetical protein C0592_06335 [Marinilabiliales bacterium]